MPSARPLALAVLVAAGLPGLAMAEVLHALIRPIEQPLMKQLPTGAVTLTVRGDELIVGVTATGLEPGAHLAHLHGFAAAEPLDAVCATVDADANGDGFVDLIETREVSGVTLVPLNEHAASLEIEAKGYPDADASGEIEYQRTVDLEALADAMEEAHGTPPALGLRVVYINGVPEDFPLPDSVQSLDGVPARLTLPIACAELDPA